MADVVDIYIKNVSKKYKEVEMYLRARELYNNSKKTSEEKVKLEHKGEWIRIGCERVFFNIGKYKCNVRGALTEDELKEAELLEMRYLKTRIGKLLPNNKYKEIKVEFPARYEYYYEDYEGNDGNIYYRVYRDIYISESLIRFLKETLSFEDDLFNLSIAFTRSFDLISLSEIIAKAFNISKEVCNEIQFVDKLISFKKCEPKAYLQAFYRILRESPKKIREEPPLSVYDNNIIILKIYNEEVKISVQDFEYINIEPADCKLVKILEEKFEIKKNDKEAWTKDLRVADFIASLLV